jgi:hypothetical protein
MPLPGSWSAKFENEPSEVENGLAPWRSLFDDEPELFSSVWRDGRDGIR